MSLNGSSECPEGDARGFDGRRTVLDLDLNYPPPEESISLTDSQDVQPQENEHFQGEPLNNAESIDEEVSVISPGKFAEAMNNSQRNHSRRRARVIDRINHPAEAYFNVSESIPFSHIKHRFKVKESNVSMPTILSDSEPQYEEPAFSCPICKDQLNEETSTKCGHIFCKKCIEVAIATQHKCPTCRHKLRKRDIFRIYLPTAS